MKRARIKQIDAFTSAPFTGNPAHILTEANKLSDDEMRKIAQESPFETAFVQESAENGAQFKLRFFTPKSEINFAGHLTIAAFHALAEEAKFFLSEPVTKIAQETKSGKLAVEIYSYRSKINRITIELPPPTLLQALDSASVAEALRINPTEMEKTAPQVVDVGSAHLIVPVKNRKVIENLKPDLYSLSEINLSNNAISTHVYALDAISPLAMVHSRNFAPSIGIPETAASGTATGALGAYLIGNEVIRGNSPITFVAEQGYTLGRPSEITVEIHFQRTKVNKIRVSGQAVTIMEGEIFL